VSGEKFSFSPLMVLKILSAIFVNAQSYGTLFVLQVIFRPSA
jgi:hypothetical protein